MLYDGGPLYHVTITNASRDPANPYATVKGKKIDLDPLPLLFLQQ